MFPRVHVLKSNMSEVTIIVFFSFFQSCIRLKINAFWKFRFRDVVQLRIFLTDTFSLYFINNLFKRRAEINWAPFDLAEAVFVG